MVSSVNGSRMNPPVDPIGDKTVERARREFMEAVRSGDRQTRQAIEAVRDEADRTSSDSRPDLRRVPERPLDRSPAGPGSIVHLETARGPERGLDRNRADGAARREAAAASRGRQEIGRGDGSGRDAARQEGLGQGSLRPESGMSGISPSVFSGRRDTGLSPMDPLGARLPTGRPRPEPIGPPPPPGYRPPPPVAPEGTVLIGPVPARDALNLVAATDFRGGANGPLASLRLSSTTPREVAERIAGFMETGKLDTSPVRFSPVTAVLSGGADEAEPEAYGQPSGLARPDPGAESSALAALGNDVRSLGVS